MWHAADRRWPHRSTGCRCRYPDTTPRLAGNSAWKVGMATAINHDGQRKARDVRTPRVKSVSREQNGAFDLLDHLLKVITDAADHPPIFADSEAGSGL